MKKISARDGGFYSRKEQGLKQKQMDWFVNIFEPAWTEA